MIDLRLRIAVLTPALISLAVTLIVGILQVSYPFELEWIEGLTLHHVQRILAGAPIYVPPTLDFIPSNYTPLYPWLASLLARLMGAGFAPLRLLSFAATLGCFAVIFALVRRETGKGTAALLAACLYAATRNLSGDWFAVARPDTVYVFLLLLGAYTLRFGNPPVPSAAIAGLLFALAFLAKQSAIVVAAPLALSLWWIDRRQMFALVATAAVALGGITVWLQHQTGGWYLFYAFQVALAHAAEMKRLVQYARVDLAELLGLSMMIGACFFVLPSQNPRRRGRLFFLALAGGMIASSAILRMYPGGFQNVLLTAHAGVAILFGLGWAACTDALAGVAPHRRVRIEGLLVLASVVQFGMMMFDPRPAVPSRKDIEAGNQLVQTLRDVPGPVLVVSHPYLGALAGKPLTAHEMSATDLIMGGGPLAADMRSQFDRALSEHRWAAVVKDGYRILWFDSLLVKYYRPDQKLMTDGRVFWPRTGTRKRPELIYVPIVPQAH